MKRPDYFQAAPFPSIFAVLHRSAASLAAVENDVLPFVVAGVCVPDHVLAVDAGRVLENSAAGRAGACLPAAAARTARPPAVQRPAPNAAEAREHGARGGEGQVAGGPVRGCAGRRPP